MSAAGGTTHNLAWSRMHESPAAGADETPRAIARRIGKRFRRRLHGGYARSKLRMDPAFAAATRQLGGTAMPVLDIGCGLGLLGFYLREHGYAGDYFGLDLDAAKITAAQEVADAHYRGLSFRVGDARALTGFAGHVVMLDVLHYLERDDQRALLDAAARCVAPGGLLVIRNVLREPGWRFRATVAEEGFIHLVRWLGSPPCHYPDRAEIQAPLEAAGLACTVEPLWGRTPFNSYLIVGRRAATGAGSAGT